jgi:hypothetical protein
MYLTSILLLSDGANSEPWAVDLKSNNFRALCLADQTEECYLSWATPGQVRIILVLGGERKVNCDVSYLYTVICYNAVSINYWESWD